MGILKGVVVIWQVMTSVLKFRHNLETKGSSYITTEKCLAARLWLEKVFHALETGNTKGLPIVIQWLFKNTKLDNELGRAGKDILKSDKLATGDKVLNQPLYQAH